MKVAVIGAGSTYTPELVSGLSGLAVDELGLHDIDAERLGVVSALARRMLDRQGYAGGLTVTSELEEAVEGADFVLVQIRVGGQSARLSDDFIVREHFSEESPRVVLVVDRRPSMSLYPIEFPWLHKPAVVSTAGLCNHGNSIG